METKTKRLLLENYKKMYKAMKNSADKQRIGKLIEELDLSSCLLIKINFRNFKSLQRLSVGNNSISDKD